MIILTPTIEIRNILEWHWYIRLSTIYKFVDIEHFFGIGNERLLLKMHHIMRSFEVPTLYPSHGRIFGTSRPLKRSLFLFGKQLGGGFWPIVMFSSELSLYLVGVSCAVIVGKQWIINWSIVMLLRLCGA